MTPAKGKKNYLGRQSYWIRMAETLFSSFWLVICKSLFPLRPIRPDPSCPSSMLHAVTQRIAFGWSWGLPLIVSGPIDNVSLVKAAQLPNWAILTYHRHVDWK